MTGREGHWFIYFVQQVNGGPIKIGLALNPESRLRGLQTGNPDELVLRGFIRNGSEELERALHHKFRKFRQRGEWFRPNRRLNELITRLELLNFVLPEDEVNALRRAYGCLSQEELKELQYEESKPELAGLVDSERSMEVVQLYLQGWDVRDIARELDLPYPTCADLVKSVSRAV